MRGCIGAFFGAIVGVFAVLIVCIWGCGIVLTSMSESLQSTGEQLRNETRAQINEMIETELDAPKAEPSRLQSPVTHKNFNRIQTGMMRQEVSAILGHNGTLKVKQEMLGIKHEMWEWRQERLFGGIIHVYFQDDRVYSKAQNGL